MCIIMIWTIRMSMKIMILLVPRMRREGRLVMRSLCKCWVRICREGKSLRKGWIVRSLNRITNSIKMSSMSNKEKNKCAMNVRSHIPKSTLYLTISSNPTTNIQKRNTVHPPETSPITFMSMLIDIARIKGMILRNLTKFKDR